MATGTILRKDVIADDAISWGKDYADMVNKAIEKNKEFVDTIVSMSAANEKLRQAQKDYLENQKVVNGLADKTITAWKEQNELEKALISTKKRNQLATEGTNRALQKERVLLAETNKEIKLQARESLGLVGAMERLNRARNEAQKRLGDLLSAEKKNIAQIVIAQMEFDKLDARIKAVDAAIKNYSKNIGNYASAFNGLAGSLGKLMNVFGVASGFALLGTIVKDIFSVIRDFDRQLIAVGKTTNLSGKELKEFGRAVVEMGDKMDGISIEGLLASAEVAGQLGVTGTENLLKFSSTIEKLKQTSNIISDEQVGQFAKFIEVSSDSFENADKLGSVITQLGNSFATTEAEVLANSTEIQKGIAVYETSAQGALALGAATSTLGSEAEASRSAIQSTFAIINDAVAKGTNLQKVLKLTGLTQAELSAQFNKDATGVFQKFIKGLSNAKNEGQNLSLVLDDLGIKEKRAFTVVGALAANYGVLEGAMAMASDEYENNAALNKEMAAATQSLSSIISDIRDKWESYVLTTNDARGGTEILAKALKFLRDNMEAIISFVVKAGTVFLVYIGVLRTINFLTTTWSALQVAATAGQIRFAMATGIGTKAILEQAAAARAATGAIEGMNVATKATPWGLIIALILATTTAYAAFNDSLSETEESQKRINDALAANKKAAEESTKANIEFFNSQLQGITDVYNLRRAAQGESAALTQQEIAEKKRVAEIAIETNLEQMNSNSKLIADIKKTSDQKLGILSAEATRLREIADRTSGYGNDMAANRAEEQLRALKEQTSKSINALKEQNRQFMEENKTYEASLADFKKQSAIKVAQAKSEEDAKAKAARIKRLRELYELEKKAQDDEFKLRQFRLQVAIDANQEILNNEKASVEDRLDAMDEGGQLLEAKARELAENQLRNLGKYNEDTGKFTRELSDEQIKVLLMEGKNKERLTNEQLLIYETFQNSLTKINKKGADDRQKIIDSEVATIQKQIDSQLQLQDIALNEAIEFENQKLKAILDSEKSTQAQRLKAVEENERQIFEIKKKFAKDSLLLQISALEKELVDNDAKEEHERISAEKRQEIAQRLQQLKTEFSNENFASEAQNIRKLEELIRDSNERTKQLAMDLGQALVDFTNAVFSARIDNIDRELAAEEEKYNASMEAAGNDARQKELIEREFEKKRKKLEAEKRKEQVKAAIFNKVIALAQIGLNLAQTISAINLAAAAIDALTLGVGGSVYRGVQIPLAIGIAAAQTATVLATPPPKYKDGREDGPRELAEVGDGGRREVISKQDGSNPRLTPNRPTITLLEKHDIVHPSEDHYRAFMRRKLARDVKNETIKLQMFQESQGGGMDRELLQEMRLTRKAIEKKQPVHVHTDKVDIGHLIWGLNNKKW